MPRQARLVVPNIALHVVQRGHDRKACFRHDTDYLVYLTTLHQLAPGAGCAIHAYCLMTNHVHLLLTPTAGDSCANILRDLGQRYVQYFNRRYARTGTLWESRYRSCLVDSAQYVLACYRYIELNPVRAGMVGSPVDYRWSSHLGNAGHVMNKLLTPHPEYTALASDPPVRHAAYRELFAHEDEPAFLAQVRDATNGGFALVGDSTKARIQSATGRYLERRKPGPAGSAAPEGDLLSEELGLCPRTN
jgi:putative transposase